MIMIQPDERLSGCGNKLGGIHGRKQNDGSCDRTGTGIL